VHVLDELRGHSEPLRLAGMAADYVRVHLDDPSLEGLEDDRIAEAPLGLSSALLSAAGERLNARSRLISAAFRYSESADELGWRVAGGGPGAHPAGHVAIMALGEPDARSRPNRDSVALWRHTPSGAVGGDTAPLEDRFRSEAWAMQGLVPLLSERLVIVPTAAYLSLWPMSLPGGSRLIWVAYVDIHSA